MKKKNPQNIPSHFAFGEHWNELSEYAGYVPEKKQWQSIKDEFYVLLKHNNENPKFIILQKGKENVSVYVYGFKEEVTKRRIAFCKTIVTKEHIAIEW